MNFFSYIYRDDTFSKINASGKKYCLQMEKLWIKMFGKKQDVATARYKTVQIHILVSNFLY